MQATVGLQDSSVPPQLQQYVGLHWRNSRNFVKRTNREMRQTVELISTRTFTRLHSFTDQSLSYLRSPLRHHQYPVSGKKHYINPVFQSTASQQQDSDYRPISITPVLCRILERIGLIGLVRIFCILPSLHHQLHLKFKSEMCKLRRLTNHAKHYHLPHSPIASTACTP